MSDNDVELAAAKYADEQDAARGDWNPGRVGAVSGEPPYPDPDNPILAYLIDQAAKDAQTHGPQVALLHAVVHAWFEGHIEGYDRAMKHKLDHASEAKGL